MNVNGGSNVSAAPTGSIIRWIAAQIPEFEGTEDENVITWTKRVDKVATIYGATDGVTLLVALSCLVKKARR